MIKGWTISEAAHRWVSEFNAVPRAMIEQLMMDHPDEWEEVTGPRIGDQVYVYDLPEEIDALEHGGEIRSYDEGSELYCIELYNGKLVSAEKDNFDVERDDRLPMWGTMWSFGDSCDDWWLEEDNGIHIMSECGFRIYVHEEFGYFFGIDGAGYDFYESHWIPLYKKRGLHWHDPAAEKEAAMLNKGYHKGKLGQKCVWLDESDNVITEV